MKQKSLSLGKLSASPQNPSPKITYLNYHSRLNFPINGDTLFYSNSGRKHYDNQSDRMLRIIHPREFALDNPLKILPRQNSVPPPHLIPHFPEISPLNLKQESSKNTPKTSSIASKVEDQLDRMKIQLQKKKIVPMMSNKLERLESQPMAERRKASPLSLLSPKVTEEHIFPQSEPKKEKVMGYLCDPQNKSNIKMGDGWRARNPSFLSSGLSII